MSVGVLNVALLGAGSVGAQTARLLLENADELQQRCGVRLNLIGIGVRDVHAQRDVVLPESLLTTDLAGLVARADVLIELIGGVSVARECISQALRAGVDVVTANKALLAEHGEELFALAAQSGAQLSYEAAVAAAIPIVRPLRESFAGDRIHRVMGIVNGSTNYILDRMDRFGDSAEEACAVAAKLGYLEADPTLDVEGFDAAQKITILASLAFHTSVPAHAVHREGITGVSLDQVQAAKAAGYVIKLLAIAERVRDAVTGQEMVSARVHPALISREHPLAAVHGGKNAVFVEAEAAGSLMFYGAGAGGAETASAVLGDLVSTARLRAAGVRPGALLSSRQLPVAPIGVIATRYQFTLTVHDEPGVLAAVSSLLATHGVSIETVIQHGRTAAVATLPESAIAPAEAGTATLVIGTHTASEAALSATVSELASLEAVLAVPSVLRIEGN